jgi:integrase
MRQVRGGTISTEDVVARGKAQTRTQARKQRKPGLDQIEFYRVLDSLPSRWRPFFVTLTLTGLRLEELRELRPEDLDHETRAIRVMSPTGTRTIYVAEELWHWVTASVPVPCTLSLLRENWWAAVDRSGFKKVSVTELQRLRSKLLAEAKDRSGLRLVRDEAREEARLLLEALPVLALTEDEARRLVLREVRG